MFPRSVVRVGALLFVLWPFALSAPSVAQPSTGIGIKWEVKNRFRLFKYEYDFDYMVRFHGRAGILADETSLARATSGVGWASRFVNRLCVISQGSCSRFYLTPGSSLNATSNEPYLVPDYHRVTVTAEGAPIGALCTWRFVTERNNSIPDVKRNQPCDSEVVVRVPYGKTTRVQLFVAAQPEDAQPSVTTEIAVRDLLIAGLGDSIAAGEGDPDREIGLASGGFCFRRFGLFEATSYFRPSRRGYDGDRSCSGDVALASDDATKWFKEDAVWMDVACHRSLYSYQVRVALALAIENPQIAVTYIPLACSGSTIANGMLGEVQARQSDCAVNPGNCSRFVKGQIATLDRIMSAVHRIDKNRKLDLVLLTIGANDIGFAGLTANVMIDHTTPEFRIFSAAGLVSNVPAARTALKTLASQFVKLREVLKPLMNNTMDHVIYVTYANPALYDNGQPCPQTRQGFDVHPAFAIDGALLKSTSDFVNDEFLPRLKAIATCEPGGGCQSPSYDRMTFVDAHQSQFRNHGFCAQAIGDPPFDRGCFTRDGRSFTADPIAAPLDPMGCHKPANFFRAYASRQRWIRTANDSYFAAMSYPDANAKYLQPESIHDPIWGAASAVYGAQCILPPKAMRPWLTQRFRLLGGCWICRHLNSMRRASEPADKGKTICPRPPPIKGTWRQSEPRSEWIVGSAIPTDYAQTGRY
jgi:lysophospholipase L1-like esterase